MSFFRTMYQTETTSDGCVWSGCLSNTLSTMKMEVYLVLFLIIINSMRNNTVLCLTRTARQINVRVLISATRSESLCFFPISLNRIEEKPKNCWKAIVGGSLWTGKNPNKLVLTANTSVTTIAIQEYSVLSDIFFQTSICVGRQ
jgi:hypothetical protein